MTDNANETTSERAREGGGERKRGREGGDNTPVMLGVLPEAELRMDLINRSNSLRRWTAMSEAYKFPYMPWYIPEALSQREFLSHTSTCTGILKISIGNMWSGDLSRLLDRSLSSCTFLLSKIYFGKSFLFDLQTKATYWGHGLCVDLHVPFVLLIFEDIYHMAGDQHRECEAKKSDASADNLFCKQKIVLTRMNRTHQRQGHVTCSVA